MSSLDEVQALARSLMDEHHLSDWSFGFDRAKTRGGVCNLDKRRIQLSEHFARKASRAEVVETLTHEVAHALVGPDHGHDATWRAKAVEIGCTGETYCKHFEQPKWIGTCESCGNRWERHRRRGSQCPDCRKPITWTANTEKSTEGTEVGA